MALSRLVGSGGARGGMVALGQSTQIGIKDTGVSVTVADNDVAKLMYYLSCMCSALDLKSEAGLDRLIKHKNYSMLSESEKAKLIALCLALNPVELNGKCIFAVEDTGKNSDNRFLELSATETTFLASSAVIIGGQKRDVTKIMTYKISWLQKYYVGPLERILEKVRREKIETEAKEREERQQRERRERETELLDRLIREDERRRRRKSNKCTIL